MLQDFFADRKPNGTTHGVEKSQRHAGGASPRKQIAWLVKNPPEGSVTINVTPEIADVMLTYNDRNRPVSNSRINLYARQMTEGKWHYTGQTIIFSHDGRLLDGQHRLMACLESGATFQTDVKFGVPDEAFAFIDIGAKRTPSDIFAINGVKNWSLMAAAVPWVYGYENRSMGSGAAGAHRLTPDETYQIYLHHSGMSDSAWVGHLFKHNRLAPPALMTALHYLCARKSRRDADQFFEKIGNGLGFSGAKDPAYRLHKRLVENATRDEKMSRLRMAAITVKAWNASRSGRTPQTFPFAEGESFPRIR